METVPQDQIVHAAALRRRLGLPLLVLYGICSSSAFDSAADVVA